MKQVGKIGNLVVKNYTRENLIVHKTKAVKAPAELVWKIVSNHAIFSKWMPMVSNVDTNDAFADNDGNGCQRVCTFGKDKIKETVIHIEENKIFGYSAEDTAMFKNHLAVVKITGVGYSHSFIEYFVFFKPLGMKGFMMKYIMLPRVLKKALKNLSKLVA